MTQVDFAFGGVSGVQLVPESFDLGGGVTLRRTFAHLFSTNLMAFSPPGPRGVHGGPWRAARGGFGFDVEVEICAPSSGPVDGFDARETIWWIAALLRMIRAPYLSVPVISDHPFDAAKSVEELTLTPFETERRIFIAPDDSARELDDDTLFWMKENWIPAAELLMFSPKFATAFKAFDSATVVGRASASLLALWGALEQLFAPSPGELRFRVSALLASYLEQPGPGRLNLYKELLGLYNHRSTAAHTAQGTPDGALVATYVHLRNALMKMIHHRAVPTQSDLESLLFGVESIPFYAGCP